MGADILASVVYSLIFTKLIYTNTTIKYTSQNRSSYTLLYNCAGLERVATANYFYTNATDRHFTVS